MNERTNEQTNKQTNKQTNILSCITRRLSQPFTIQTWQLPYSPYIALYFELTYISPYFSQFAFLVIPGQFNQHFVLDFLYMLTNCAKICLGYIFQVVASKVLRFLRCAASSARRLVAICSNLILVPTSEVYISAMEADVVMKSCLPIDL